MWSEGYDTRGVGDASLGLFMWGYTVLQERTVDGDKVLTACRFCPLIPAIQKSGGISLSSMMGDIDRVGNPNQSAPGQYCF